MINWGSTVSSVATPFARAFGMDCVDPVTGLLRPESTCAKTAQAMDERRWRDAFTTRFPIFDRFWSNTTGDKMKEYGVQLVIKAENLTELESKFPKDVEILAVQVKPPKPQMPQPAMRVPVPPRPTQ